MNYFNLLQNYSESALENLIDSKVNITYHTSRFAEYSNDDIRLKFNLSKNPSISILKNFPVLISFENFKDFLAIAKLEEVVLDKTKQTITATLKLLTTKVKIDNKIKLQELESALQFTGLEKTRTHWAIKDSNLFEKLRPLHIFDNLDEVERNFPQKNLDLLKPSDVTGTIDTVVDTDFNVEIKAKYNLPPTSNLSMYIFSVAEYIKKVLEINAVIDGKKENRELFYRGHGKESYNLEPSLLRNHSGGKGKVYLKGEHLLFRELLTTEPLSFANDFSGFDILTRMQHYGMPTRLLDISSNPLTALYFACENLKHDDNGEVIIISVRQIDICFFDSDKIACLTNLAKLTSSQKDQLSNYIITVLKNNPNKLILDEADLNEKAYEQYLHYILNEKPYFKPKVKITDLKNVLCVKGRLNQERIIAQSGSFLIFGLDAELSKNGNDVFDIYSIKIKKEDKEKILKELDLLKINQRTVYPSIENSANHIKSRLENFYYDN